MKRSVIGIALGLSLSVIGVLIVGNEVQGGVPRVARIWPIALAIMAMVVCWFIQGTVMAILTMPYLGRFQVLQMTRIYLASQGVAALTPFGGAELPYQVLLLTRRRLPASLAAAVITIKSILNGTVLVAGTLVGLLFVSGLPAVRSEVLVGAAIGLILGWALLEFTLRRRRQPGPRDRRSGSVVGGWRARLSSFLADLREGVAQIRSQEPRAIATCLVLMVFYWMLYPLLGVLGLVAAGWSGSGWAGVFFSQFLLYLVVIPIAPTPGGSGVAEVGFASIMSAYVPQTDLLAGVLIWRALNHYSELVIGAYFAGRDVEEEIELAVRTFSHRNR